jgi:hypothetical protein
VKDYTVSVYSPSKVTITDANGKTNDPTNPSAVVTAPVVTTPVVTTPVVTTPVVTTPVVTTPVVVAPVVTPVTDTAVSAQLEAALAVAVTQNAAKTYSVTYGTANYLYQGKYPANSAFYFAQLQTSNTHFYVFATVTLKSVG